MFEQDGVRTINHQEMSNTALHQKALMGKSRKVVVQIWYLNLGNAVMAVFSSNPSWVPQKNGVPHLLGLTYSYQSLAS
ncbi:hypothetical protein [Vreelandella populi]|uniref:Uncharacterized protein n=1 Tax=Vreelandella populi TaxID=2498858 RepID=A0A433LCA8_9GAMM|nr:hypothetical protein [Halomonas populi]RUR46187.1 hypothetical protein ELY37_09365 [Halomonas populi]